VHENDFLASAEHGLFNLNASRQSSPLTYPESINKIYFIKNPKNNRCQVTYLYIILDFFHAMTDMII